jgi:hypothetical protein
MDSCWRGRALQPHGLVIEFHLLITHECKMLVTLPVYVRRRKQQLLMHVQKLAGITLYTNNTFRDIEDSTWIDLPSSASSCRVCGAALATRAIGQRMSRLQARLVTRLVDTILTKFYSFTCKLRNKMFSLHIIQGLRKMKVITSPAPCLSTCSRSLPRRPLSPSSPQVACLLPCSPRF